MTTARTEAELVVLRRLAEELAARRKERVTSTHLLAAIAHRPSAAADLLHERRLTGETLLRSARASSDDATDPMRHALHRARDLARRVGASEPGAAHLLVALLSDEGCAARRTLEQHGVDVARLRTFALELGQGLIGRRRVPARAAERQVPRDASSRPARSAAKRPPSGVALSLMAESRRSLPPPTPLPQPRPKAAATLDRFALDEKRFATLCGLGKNLTLAAAKGELDPVVGRAAEVERALDVLAKREGNNPCLVGPAGVGKTSVAHAIAQRIADSPEVASLDNRTVVEIPVTELVAGTGVRGSLATRLSAIRREVLAAEGRVVLFFDEIHQLFTGEAADEIGAELKLALAKGELPIIGATTPEDYKRAIESDSALARRFTLVEVEEPGREEAFLVLSALAPKLGLHHGLTYADDALALAVAWSMRYLPGRALPDKAISILDLAGARARRRGKLRVVPENVAEVVAELADMPIERLLESDGERMLALERTLAERIVGHAEPIGRIARILRRNAAGLGSRRPIGTFLLLGPTGVGKTETAKAVAEVLFGSDQAMTRLDLSEYSEAHAIARLLGAPPGYVGHEAGGQLTEAVRRRPYQVLLLDEVEKAHPDVLTAFLAVFDEGRMTDGRGRTVDFTNTVIFLTSNLGADETGSSVRRRVGFGGDGAVDREELARRVIAAVRSALAPELYNRIDEALVFTPLSRDEVREIARRLLAGVARALKERRGIVLEHDSACIEHLLDGGGFDTTLGARPMKRTLARLVEAPLADKILAGEVESGDVVLLGAENGELVLDVIAGGARAAE